MKNGKKKKKGDLRKVSKVNRVGTYFSLSWLDIKETWEGQEILRRSKQENLEFPLTSAYPSLRSLLEEHCTECRYKF